MPSVRISVTVLVLVSMPSTMPEVVAVTVFATSRTVSMVCLTVFLPFSSTSVMVLMSFRTPSTIWREVSVMTCFCWVLPLDKVSVMFSVVRVILPSISVVVSEMDLTTSAVAFLALDAAFLPEVFTAAAAEPADLVTVAAAALAAVASSLACWMRWLCRS